MFDLRPKIELGEAVERELRTTRLTLVVVGLLLAVAVLVAASASAKKGAAV